MTPPDTPASAAKGEAVKPLYGPWNYLKDPDGLALMRQSLVETGNWHDPAPINCNSLARLLDTIEALRAQPHPSQQAGTEGVLDRAVNLGCPTDEPTLREMVAHYYRSHSMPGPLTWTDRYVAALNPSEAKG